MGQYKLSFYFNFQIGILLKIEPLESIVIELPFISIHIGLTKNSKGFRLFKD